VWEWVARDGMGMGMWMWRWHSGAKWRGVGYAERESVSGWEF